MLKIILKKELFSLGKEHTSNVLNFHFFFSSNSFNVIFFFRDAAHTIHPLDGQGLNQGLADVQCLLKVIEQGISNGQDIGKYFLIQLYDH